MLNLSTIARTQTRHGTISMLERYVEKLITNLYWQKSISICVWGINCSIWDEVLNNNFSNQFSLLSIIAMKRYKVIEILMMNIVQKLRKSIADVTSLHSILVSVSWSASGTSDTSIFFISLFADTFTFFEQLPHDLQRRPLSNFTIFM